MTTAPNEPSVDKDLQKKTSNPDGPKEKRPVTKEKLRSIMEAASALTALGDDEDGEEGDDGASTKQPQEGKDEGEGTPGKRYIPEHKKPDAALTFPEKVRIAMVILLQPRRIVLYFILTQCGNVITAVKLTLRFFLFLSKWKMIFGQLMSMMRRAEEEDSNTFCIAWLPDGKSFVIRNPDEFTRNVLPNYFKATKFSSYTRKLYRWGFRQVNRGIGPDDPIIFGNEYFQRDNVELMVKMRSITAAGTRKAQTIEPDEMEVSRVNKRPLDMNMMSIDEQCKRMMLEHMLQQQKFGGMQGVPDQHNYLQQQASLQQFNLAAALRPSMAMQHKQQMGYPQMNSQSFNQNPLGLYMAPQQQQQHQIHGIHQHQLPSMHQNPQYNSASTAEIVNAAINALRFAS
jgi:HSF-type DNA-binding